MISIKEIKIEVQGSKRTCPMSPGREAGSRGGVRSWVLQSPPRGRYAASPLLCWDADKAREDMSTEQ